MGWGHTSAFVHGPLAPQYIAHSALPVKTRARPFAVYSNTDSCTVDIHADRPLRRVESICVRIARRCIRRCRFVFFPRSAYIPQIIYRQEVFGDIMVAVGR